MLTFAAQFKTNKEMNKRLIIIALCAFMGLAFASCSRPSVVGTWVEAAQDEAISEETGFTLLEDGKVLPINMGFYEFNAWQQNGQNIIFQGQYTGSNPHDFADTLKIVELTKEKLVLEQAGYSITYKRK